MNTISSQNPSLTDALSGLAAQTQPAGYSWPQDPAASGDPTFSPPGEDVLSLSGRPSEEGLEAAARETGLQNRQAALADFPAALAATNAAGQALRSNPQGALGSQANLNALSALSLIQES